MRRVLLSMLALSALAAPVQAQTLRDHVIQLFTFGTCGQPLCLQVNEAIHGMHYIPSVTQGQNNMVAFLYGSIGLSVGNIPFTAASNGVTFSFEGGRPVASTVSPGPIFAERGQTLGRGRLLMGANVSGLNFDNLRGIPLSDLEFKFPHQNVGDPAEGDPQFENDIIEVTTDLHVDVLVASVYASYGLTDRVDLGLLVPFVRTSLRGTSHAVINQAEPNSPHFFGTPDNPSLTADTATSGSASGIGDLGARLKVNVIQGGTMDVALLGDVRLPTGSEKNFLGSGATTFRALALVSAHSGNFTPHLNTGMLITNGADLNNRLLGTIGFDQLLSPRATLAVDLVASYETAASKLYLPPPEVYTAPVVRTVPLSNIPDQKDNLVDASFGAKFVLPGEYRLITNLLIPLAKGGMRPKFMWTAGLERTF